MGCSQAKYIRVSLRHDTQLDCWRLRAFVMRGKKRSHYLYRRLSSFVADADSIERFGVRLSDHPSQKRSPLSYGHVGKHTLLIYKLDPSKAQLLAQVIGKFIDAQSCSCFSIPIHLTLHDYQNQN